MKNNGFAHMGIGYGSGDNRAEEAAKAAIESPLLETSIEGAKGVLVNITGSSNLNLFDVSTINTIIQEKISTDADNYIFGTVTDESMGDDIKVTVVATGFDSAEGGEVIRPMKKIKTEEENQEPIIEEDLPVLEPVAPVKLSEESQKEQIDIFDKDILDIPSFIDSMSKND